MPNNPANNKYKPGPDGLFHCPECGYTHKRAASIGRHRMKHSGQPYGQGTSPGRPRKPPSDAELEYKRAKQREYSRAHAERRKANKLATLTPVNAKETSHVNGTNTHSQEFDQTRYLLAGGFLEKIQSAARALNCSEGELTSGIVQILRAATVR